MRYKDVKGIRDDYFEPFAFGVTGFATTDVPGTLTYNLLLDAYFNSGIPYNVPLRYNSVTVDRSGNDFLIRANCCSYIYLADTAEEKAFPFIARNRLKGDTGIVLDKDVKIHNSYILTDSIYTYYAIPTAFGTDLITSDGKVIQSSNMLPFSPRNSKERRLLESA